MLYFDKMEFLHCSCTIFRKIGLYILSSKSCFYDLYNNMVENMGLEPMTSPL